MHNAIIINPPMRVKLPQLGWTTAHLLIDNDEFKPIVIVAAHPLTGQPMQYHMREIVLVDPVETAMNAVPASVATGLDGPPRAPAAKIMEAEKNQKHATDQAYSRGIEDGLRRAQNLMKGQLHLKGLEFVRAELVAAGRAYGKLGPSAEAHKLMWDCHMKVIKAIDDITSDKDPTGPKPTGAETLDRAG